MKENFSHYNQFDSFGRATIVPSMSKTSGEKQKRKKRTSKPKSNTSVRLIKGKVVLKVPGYQGVQRLAPSNLIQHINKKNLKNAAKSALKKSGVKKSKKRSIKRKAKK